MSDVVRPVVMPWTLASDVDVPSQRVTNMSWPQGSQEAGWHARDIPDQPTSISVEVRIVWEHDGEEWRPGRATRWTASHVFVPMSDPRLVGPGVWVRAADVRRIAPEPGHGIPAP